MTLHAREPEELAPGRQPRSPPLLEPRRFGGYAAEEGVIDLAPAIYVQLPCRMELEAVRLNLMIWCCERVLLTGLPSDVLPPCSIASLPRALLWAVARDAYEVRQEDHEQPQAEHEDAESGEGLPTRELLLGCT